MTEVSSWSATDASNNLTPPDGWPEGMQPSGVNDVGRMMMGAIRRWYNTVTAGIANALPLTGGTLTGGLTATAITSTGPISASGNIGTSADISARNIGASGGVSAANISASGNITATSQLQGNTVVGGTVTSNGALNVAGTVTADTISANTIVASTQLSSGGNINAINLNASNSVLTNNLNATNFITTGVLQIAGITFAQRGPADPKGPSIVINDDDGNAALQLYGQAGSYYRCDDAHFFTNRAATFNVAKLQTTDGNCINNSGSWSTFSDAAVKENLTEYTAGLSEVLQLNPKSFTYIPGKTGFGIDGETHYGLVAQEVEPVLPEMVGHTTLADGETSVATLSPTHMVYVLINCVKELAAINDEMAARLSQLENGGG